MGQPCCWTCPETPLRPPFQTWVALRARARAGPRGMTGTQGQPPWPTARHGAPSPQLRGTQTWGLGRQRPSVAFPQGTLWPVHEDRELTSHGLQGWQGPVRVVA